MVARRALGQVSNARRCVALQLLPWLLSSIRRDILVTSRNTPIPQLFDVFIAEREHIALVVDEYGSVSGLVSMEDVFETLLGLEIMDESDNVEDLQQLARKKWKSRAKRLGIIEENTDIE